MLLSNNQNNATLLTLVFLYVGYRLWGLFGMILAPLLAAAVRSLTLCQRPETGEL